MRAAGGRARGITWVALVGACAAPAACGWGTLAGDTTTYPDDAPPTPSMTGTPVGPPLLPDGSDDGGTGEDAVGDATVTDGTVGDGSFPTAAHAPWPRVPDTEGGVLRSPSLVTIVASNDAPVAGTDTAPMLHGFSDAFGATDVWAAVSAEYGVGALTSVAHLTGPAIAPGTYPTAFFQSYVGAVLGGDAGPAPNGDTIYLLYVPYGVVFSGSDDPCGYHAAYPTLGASAGDQLALVRRCTPSTVETQLGVLTIVASHEIVESATDSLDRGFNLGVTPSTPWDASVWQSFEGFGHVELGDLCEGTRIFDALDGGPDGGWEIPRKRSCSRRATGSAASGSSSGPPSRRPRPRALHLPRRRPRVVSRAAAWGRRRCSAWSPGASAWLAWPWAACSA